MGVYSPINLLRGRARATRIPRRHVFDFVRFFVFFFFVLIASVRTKETGRRFDPDFSAVASREKKIPPSPQTDLFVCVCPWRVNDRYSRREFRMALCTHYAQIKLSRPSISMGNARKPCR